MGQSYVETGDAPLIEAIQRGVETKEFEIGGVKYTDRQVHLPPLRDLVRGLAVSSLQSVVDYVTQGVDAEARGEIVVAVLSPTEVAVYSQAKELRETRFKALSAEYQPPRSVADGNYQDLETAVINLQATTENDEEQARLLKLLGNIAHDESVQAEDDGVSQTVTVKRGMRKAEERIENPFYLSPFRTFPDIEQPSSPFIARLRKTDAGFQVLLALADGGKWQTEAQAAIKAFLNLGINAGKEPTETAYVPILG